MSDPDAGPVVDVHSHFLAPGGREDGPRLLIDEHGIGHLRHRASSRTVPAELWDVSRRLAALDEAGVSQQVISPLAAVMEHAWAAGPAYAREVNESIAAACADSGGRLLGLGCLPREDVADELARCRAIGLRGVAVGTTLGGLDLDDPLVAPVWEQCQAQDAAVFVHPVAHGRGVLRRDDPRMAVGLGMLTDSAIATSALVFGGVLESHPALRVAVANGGGTFAAAYPRLRDLHLDHGAPEHWDLLVRRIDADATAADLPQLTLLAHRFGSDRLLLGSDAPFMPGQLLRMQDVARAAVATAVADAAALLRGNALAFLGGGR
ncbi:amidohydrolase family protein [Microbacterium sp. RD1]|uniref:amidohydrolase family protein n=1 Tax=Microbacterium sp. RD1 TaxID=3457313 RepID=UPI003FA56B1C